MAAQLSRQPQADKAGRGWRYVKLGNDADFCRQGQLDGLFHGQVVAPVADDDERTVTGWKFEF